MIEGSSTEALAWRGAVGAQYYELERQEMTRMEEETGGMLENKGAAVASPHTISAGLRSGGKWVKVSDKLLDSTNPYVPFKDSTAQPGKTYRYRIYGVNAAGQSAASLPVILTAPVPPPVPPSPPPHLHLSPPRDQVPLSLPMPAIVSFVPLKPEQASVSTTRTETTVAATALTPPTSLRPPPISKEATTP
jgi:hypothetical protein